MSDNAAIATAEGNVLISLRASRTDGSMSVRIHHKMGAKRVCFRASCTPGDRDRLLDDVSSLLRHPSFTENKEERMLGLRVVARFLLSIIRRSKGFLLSSKEVVGLDRWSIDSCHLTRSRLVN